MRTTPTPIAAVTVVALVTAAVLRLTAPPAASLGATFRAPGDPPTYAKDVAPILYKNCATCHRPGGIGPFSVLDYDTTAAHAKDIRKMVRTGAMPPWHANAPHGTFLNDRRLSDDDKALLLKWIDAGTPLGDASALPPKPEFANGWEIGQPDVVLSMPEDFMVPARGTVEYQYFEVPTNFTEDKWVQAIEIMPGARAVVHHVLVFARPPQPASPPPNAIATATSAPSDAPPAPRPKPVLVFDANQHSDDAPRADSAHAPPKMGVGSLIGTTAPGTNVLRFAPGTALRIRAGSTLVFQMHYTAKGHAMNDRTSVGFKFAPEPPAEQVLATQFYNGQFAIPPGAKDYMIPSSVGFNEAVRIYGLFPHTHLRGARWEYTLEKPDGTKEVILDVPHYDFNWQTYYLFAKPLEIPAGARIVSKAWYDNSTDNDDNPDPKATVHWGDQTWEEMQYTGILYSVNSRRLKPAP